MMNEFALPEECSIWWTPDTGGYHHVTEQGDNFLVSSCGYRTREEAEAAQFVLLDMLNPIMR